MPLNLSTAFELPVIDAVVAALTTSAYDLCAEAMTLGCTTFVVLHPSAPTSDALRLARCKYNLQGRKGAAPEMRHKGAAVGQDPRVDDAGHVEASAQNWVKKLWTCKRGMDLCIGKCYRDKHAFLWVKKKLATGTYTCRCAKDNIAGKKKN